MLDQERADRNDAAQRVQLAEQEGMPLTGSQRSDAGWVLAGTAGLAVVATDPLMLSEMTMEPFIIWWGRREVKDTSSRFSVFSS